MNTQNNNATLSIPFQSSAVAYFACCCGVFLCLLERQEFGKRKASFFQTKKILSFGKKKIVKGKKYKEAF